MNRLRRVFPERASVLGIRTNAARGSAVTTEAIAISFEALARVGQGGRTARAVRSAEALLRELMLSGPWESPPTPRLRSTWRLDGNGRLVLLWSMQRPLTTPEGSVQLACTPRMGSAP